MNACYIIYSPGWDKFYVGITHEDVSLRVHHHNSSNYGQKFTAFKKDWEVYLTIECQSVSQAVGIEKHIKRMKSRTYIKNLKVYPAMIEKLLEQYL